MEIAINIFTIVLLISVSLLCIYLIVFLKNTTKTIGSLQKDVQQIKDQVLPILTNVDLITSKVVIVTNEIESLVSAVKIIIEELKEKVDGLLDKTKKIKANIDHNGGADWFKKAVGISRGVTAFWNTLKHK